MNLLTETEFRLFRDYIRKHCGISLGDEKAYLVERRFTGLLAQTGSFSFGELYQKTQAQAQPQLGLRDKIINAITTNETLWFRDSYPYEILSTVLLPRYHQEFSAGKRRKIRIWSSGCSTGQEPYSIAITIKELCRRYPQFCKVHVEIIATDISSTVLFLAGLGRFDMIAMSRGMSPELRDRYFKNDGKVWILDDTLKTMVTFRKLNLQDDFSFLGPLDCIFCRYVLIYFSETLKIDLFTRMAKVLKPREGHLVLGGSESATHYTDKFTLLPFSRNSYYKVKEVEPL